jgi:isopentenyl diphosphate isomerase/L-lactate dehydrogenase-like FMN-dependent dehydrogenase
LQEIMDIVDGKIPILVDSGFRRGSDVMKALSLGADAVLVGWLLVVGLAADDSQGVTGMIDVVTGELGRIMSVTGCGTLADIDGKILVRRD